MLAIADPVRARRWLAAVANEITLASNKDPKDRHDKTEHINVGFTYRGLRSLQLDAKYLSIFHVKAPAFTEGAWFRAARRLGDTLESDTDFWDDPFQPDSSHVILLLHAESEEALDDTVKRLREYGGADGLSGWDEAFDAAHITDDPDDRRAHFGLKDGITRVHIEGIYQGDDPNMHKPGELLLGYTNDEGFNPWVLAKQPDEVGEFFKDGSFGVFRKMEQDEAAFNTFVGLCAAALGETREYVLSKFVGRWPDGQVIDAKSHSIPPKALPKGGRVDDFDFSQDDRAIGCPFGSHIRRMNPRKDAVVPFRRRPLIRRGMPYGKAFAKGSESEKRGLMGLFFCASIEDQFEHLVAEWAEKNPIGINNQGDCKDPLTGSHGAAPSIFDIPMPDGSSRKIVGFRPFVITRGTLYAFFPTKPALQAISKN